MASCVICHKSLILHIDDEDKEEGFSSSNEDTYIDDDVHLPCNCHFHWQCFLDSNYELTNCPNCKANVTNIDSHGNQQLLCNLNNEGGLQEGQDIFPILTEENYLRAYPEERKPRALLEFCAEGDIDAIIEMLTTEDDFDTDEAGLPVDPIRSSRDILRYQDQLGSMSSPLHVAIQNQRVEVAWLLLLLASNVNYLAFPNEVLSAARDVGISRMDQTGHIDIRSLKDAEGMTAYEKARDIGGVWESWISEGTFSREPLLKAP